MTERWYTDAELVKLKELRAAKITVDNIAKELGWSLRATQRVISNEGLARSLLPQGRNKNNVVACKLDKETYLRFSDFCAAKGISLNKEMARLIRRELDNTNGS